MHPSSTGQRRVSGRGPRPPTRSRGRFGRGPTSPAARIPPRCLPLCPAAGPHAAGRLGTRRPPARTPPRSRARRPRRGPGDPRPAALLLRAGAALGRSPTARRGRTAHRPRRSHNGRRTHRDAGLRSLRPRARAGLAAPQSSHVPRRLLETRAQPPRPQCEGATVRCPVRRRRLVPARPRRPLQRRSRRRHTSVC